MALHEIQLICVISNIPGV